MRFTQKQYVQFFSVLIFLIGFLGINFVYSAEDNDKLRVTFFDVGQGDSVFVQTPNKKDILIDGGPDRSVIEELGKVMPFYDRTIDIVIITHHHSDHIFGLIEVLKRYKVKEIYYSGLFYSSEVYVELLRQIQERKIKLTVITEPKKTEIGDGIVLNIIFPNEDLRGKEIMNINNASLVTRIDYNKDSFLFTGDAELEEEDVLLEERKNLKTDILKVAHHGSSDSNSKEFLGEVRPKIAIISVGKDDKFGHPSRRVIKRLERMGTQVYRTDLSGSIKIVSDGDRDYKVTTQK